MHPLTNSEYISGLENLRKATSALEADAVVIPFQQFLTAKSNLHAFELADVSEKEAREELIETAPTRPGLYYFEADLTQFDARSVGSLVDRFKSAWDKLNEGLTEDQRVSTPEFMENALSLHLAAGKDLARVPFYVGRAHSVRKRLRQHIRGGDSKGTSALRLVSRREALEGIPFRVSWLQVLEKVDSEDYLVIAVLEHALQTKIQPIIGMKREG